MKDAPLIILSAVMHMPELLAGLPDDIELGRFRPAIDAVRAIVDRGGQVSPITVQAESRAVGELAAAIVSADVDRAGEGDFNAAVWQLEQARRHRLIREAADAGDERRLQELLDAPRTGVMRWKSDEPMHYTAKPPPRDWRIVDTRNADAGMLGGILALLHAPGGTGKTLALAQLVVAYASRTLWLDTFKPMPRKGHGRVLWLAAEDGPAEVRHRKWQAWHAVNRAYVEDGDGQRLSGGVSSEAARNIMTITARRAGELALVECDQRGKPSRTRFASELERIVRGEGIDLVVVDPLARVIAGGDENDNQRQTFVAMTLEDIVRETGALVFAAHHERKGGKGAGSSSDSDPMRGGSALSDAARFVCQLQKEPPRENGDDPRRDAEGRMNVSNGRGGWERAHVWSQTERTLKTTKCNVGIMPADIRLVIAPPGVLVVRNDKVESDLDAKW